MVRHHFLTDSTVQIAQKVTNLFVNGVEKLKKISHAGYATKSSTMKNRYSIMLELKFHTGITCVKWEQRSETFYNRKELKCIIIKTIRLLKPINDSDPCKLPSVLCCVHCAVKKESLF